MLSIKHNNQSTTMIRTASNVTKTIAPAGAQTSGLSSGVGPDAVTSAFLSAMDGAPKRVLDEKGEASLSEWGVGDQRLVLLRLAFEDGRP